MSQFNADQRKHVQLQKERLQMQRATLLDNDFDAFSLDEIEMLCKIYDDLILRLEFKLTTGIEVTDLEIILP